MAERCVEKYIISDTWYLRHFEITNYRSKVKIIKKQNNEWDCVSSDFRAYQLGKIGYIISNGSKHDEGKISKN